MADLHKVINSIYTSLIGPLDLVTKYMKIKSTNLWYKYILLILNVCSTFFYNETNSILVVKSLTRQLQEVQVSTIAQDWPFWYSDPKCRQDELSLLLWPPFPLRQLWLLLLSSQVGQQWPGLKMGWLQKVGGHSIGQQSISPFWKKDVKNEVVTNVLKYMVWS